MARRGLDRETIEDLVSRRSGARADRDFARADALRQRLLDMGVQVMDGPEGTRWKVL
jgi:cysteinyl-tRNA synthetase